MSSPEPTKPSGSAFSKPIAGVPLWGWLAIVVVVGGGVFLMQRGKGTAKKSTVEIAEPVAQGSGYITAGYIPPTTTDEVTRILTNQEWSTAAQKDLIQKGHDPSDVATAVATYVAGENIDSAQSSLIDIALRDIGPLPQTPGGGSISKVKPLHTANGGNIFGQLLGGLASAVGLNDPKNPFAPYLDPIINNFIDQGPINGLFHSSKQILGGDLSLHGSTNSIQTPFGTLSLGGNVSTSGGSLDGSIPNVGSLGGSISPDQSAPSYSTYTVQAGDTLTTISLKLYGNAGGASQIYSANISKIPNPQHLNVGTVLQIPAASQLN